MTMRKILGSIGKPAHLLGLAPLAAVLTLSACAYHDGYRHGHHSGAAVELEFEYRDGDRVCCKRRRRDWWAHSRRDCYRDGGDVVHPRYCRYD